MQVTCATLFKFPCSRFSCLCLWFFHLLHVRKTVWSTKDEAFSSVITVKFPSNDGGEFIYENSKTLSSVVSGFCNCLHLPAECVASLLYPLITGLYVFHSIIELMRWQSVNSLFSKTHSPSALWANDRVLNKKFLETCFTKHMETVEYFDIVAVDFAAKFTWCMIGVFLWEHVWWNFEIHFLIIKTIWKPALMIFHAGEVAVMALSGPLHQGRNFITSGFPFHCVNDSSRMLI